MDLVAPVYARARNPLIPLSKNPVPPLPSAVSSSAMGADTSGEDLGHFLRLKDADQRFSCATSCHLAQWRLTYRIQIMPQISEKRPIGILAVDDHPLLREGLASAIAGALDMKLLGEATSGREAVERFRQLRPDVTLMDLRMEEMGGLQAITAIRTEFPGARIIVLTTYEGDAQALSALKAGAAGYLLKSALRKDLLDTIRAVHAGQRRIPPAIAAEIAEHLADDALSEREIEILRRVAAGKSNKLIAFELQIAENTVKAHMRSILPKLEASDRTHAVTIALKRGILDLT